MYPPTHSQFFKSPRIFWRPRILFNVFLLHTAEGREEKTHVSEFYALGLTLGKEWDRHTCIHKVFYCFQMFGMLNVSQCVYSQLNHCANIADSLWFLFCCITLWTLVTRVRYVNFLCLEYTYLNSFPSTLMDIRQCGVT